MFAVVLQESLKIAVQGRHSMDGYMITSVMEYVFYS